jgi:hypothetical protein
MAQVADFTIANQAFGTFRAELNNILAAVNSSQIGASTPTSAVAGTFWIDNSVTDTLTLKVYDGVDNLSIFSINTATNVITLPSGVVLTIDGLTTTATGTVLTLTDTHLNSTVSIRLPDATSIQDDSGNEYIKLEKTASAVNEITVTNSEHETHPEISATGDDTNIGLSLATKGTGLILFNDGAYNADATLTDGATITWDVGSSPVAKVTLGGNRTLSAPTNSASGQFISLTVIQDATGSRLLTWNSAYEFTGDVAPTLTTTASKADVFVFKYNGTVWLEVGRNLNLSIT